MYGSTNRESEVASMTSSDAESKNRWRLPLVVDLDVIMIELRSPFMPLQ